jgi:molybdenum cofactor cytidylyltransferase
VKVGAIILAAGSSSRFGGGRDKLLAEWKGHALIEYPLAAAANARMAGVITECLVVTQPTATRIKSIAAGEGCRFVHPLPPPNEGISASLRAGVAALGPGADGAIILLGDQPQVTPEAIAGVIAAANGSPQALVRAHYQGTADQLSHPVFIGRYHFGLVHETAGDKGFQALTEERGLRWTEVWFDKNNLDVDFVEDLDLLT